MVNLKGQQWGVDLSAGNKHSADNGYDTYIQRLHFSLIQNPIPSRPYAPKSQVRIFSANYV